MGGFAHLQHRNRISHLVNGQGLTCSVTKFLLECIELLVVRGPRPMQFRPYIWTLPLGFLVSSGEVEVNALAMLALGGITKSSTFCLAYFVKATTRGPLR